MRLRNSLNGNFYTAVTLPNGLGLDKLNCRLNDGVLDVRVPLAEGSKPASDPD